MDSDIIRDLNKAFENAANDIDGLECWLARDIAPLLGYDRWENFSKTIDRAKTSCTQGGQAIEDHFRDVTKMVPLGSGAERSIDDVILTRYACYLIAQNGDPRKEQIAFAQSYFALQTRKQEILEERLALAERLRARKKLVETETELSKTIYERSITDEHIQNNSEVRGVLTGRGIYPEELPPEEDIKKLERRVKAQDRKGIGSGKSLSKSEGDERIAADEADIAEIERIGKELGGE